LINNLLGNLPGPVLYGVLKDILKESNPRLPWVTIIRMFILGFRTSLGSVFIKYHEL